MFLVQFKKICNFQKINLTGGGSFKFYDKIKEALGVEIYKYDELKSVLCGYFLMNDYSTMYHLEEKNLTEILINAKKIENDSLFLNVDSFCKYIKVNSIFSFTFPHLVVNIGSGVSIIKVFSDEKIERVGGTMCGGGTLLGLSKLLIGTDSFDEIVGLAKKGDHKNVDLLVSDIYGKKIFKKNTDNETVDSSLLDQDILASSFGKIYQILHEKPGTVFKKEDIAQSLLLLICFQIAQLAYLYAEQNGIKHVCYYGNFTQTGSFTIELLNYGTSFWSKEIQSHFNDLDGYLGAIGTLSKKQK